MTQICACFGAYKKFYTSNGDSIAFAPPPSATPVHPAYIYTTIVRWLRPLNHESAKLGAWGAVICCVSVSATID